MRPSDTHAPMLFALVALGLGLWAVSSTATPAKPAALSEAMALEYIKQWASTDPASGGAFMWGEYGNNQFVGPYVEGAPPIFYIDLATRSVFDVTKDGYTFRSAALTNSLKEYLESMA